MTRNTPERRPYQQKRRAVLMAKTRQRIVAATLDLHCSVGPARTTFSMIAERAGVQRHTLYAHFPDERGLFLACSGLMLERDPLPDAAAWRSKTRPRDRMKAGLSAIYDWYSRNAAALAAVLRDAEHHALTRETVELRVGPAMAAYHEILGDGLDPHGQAMLHLALSFFTWRSLVGEIGMRREDAVDTLLGAIFGRT